MLLSPPFEHQPNYLKEEPKTQGRTPDPTRGLNAQAHPNGPRAGPRLKQTAPSPFPTGPVPFSLVVRRWKMPGRRHSGPAIPPPRPRLEGRLAASLRYIKQGVADRLSPSETPSRKLARLRAYAISSKGPLGRLDPRVAHANTISEGATARSLAPIMPRAFRGGVTAGLSPRKVRVYHRALGVAGLPCLGAAQHPPAKRGKADQPASSIAEPSTRQPNPTPQLNKPSPALTPDQPHCYPPPRHSLRRTSP